MDFTFPNSATLDFKLRSIRSEDYPAIYRIAEVTWNKTFNKILTPEQIQAGMAANYTAEAINKALLEDENFIVLTECSHLVAFAAYKQTNKYLEIANTTPTATPSIQLTKLYCLPEYQGKGCGKQLLENIEEIAQTQKLKSIHVLVNRYNEHAIAFYQKQGYEIAAELNEVYGGFLREDNLMIKYLKK